MSPGREGSCLLTAPGQCLRGSHQVSGQLQQCICREVSSEQGWAPGISQGLHCLGRGGCCKRNIRVRGWPFWLHENPSPFWSGHKISSSLTPEASTSLGSLRGTTVLYQAAQASGTHPAAQLHSVKLAEHSSPTDLAAPPALHWGRASALHQGGAGFCGTHFVSTSWTTTATFQKHSHQLYWGLAPSEQGIQCQGHKPSLVDITPALPVALHK